MIALHFEGLLSQQRWCINQFTTAGRKQRSALQVIALSLLPTTGIINYMQCDARVRLFVTLFYQHRHSHRQSGIIIGLPRVYCVVGKTVFIGRLTDPLNLC